MSYRMLLVVEFDILSMVQIPFSVRYAELGCHVVKSSRLGAALEFRLSFIKLVKLCYNWLKVWGLTLISLLVAANHKNSDDAKCGGPQI